MINEKFWLAIAFLSFVTLIIKYVGPVITKLLDNKSKQIAEEILAAKEMKEKAARLLEKAEKYYQESTIYAEKLIKDAESEAQKFAVESRQTLEAEVAKKTTAALARVKLEEESAIREIKVKIVASAMQNLTANLDQAIDKTKHDQLVSRSIQDLEKIIH